MSASTPAAVSPLRRRTFRNLWLASAVSNVGSWMHDVADSWLMMTLTTSPFMVASVQAADSLPVLLLAFPAGALADMVDRRRLLLVTQTWMALAAAALGALTMLHLVTPWMLLAFTFILGLGSAINVPAWQASLPDLVPRDELTSAIALNGVGFNASRLIGPALGGALVASVGSGPVFLINGATFLCVIGAVYCWRQGARAQTAPAERMAGAMIAGARYARHSPALHAVFWRAGLFIVFGSALWALLPVLVRTGMGSGSLGYGVLVGSLGAGAVGGSVFLPRARALLQVDGLVLVAELIFAGCLLGLARAHSLPYAVCVMVLCGTAWIALLATFSAAVQRVVPAWVRGRAIALYQVVFQGGMALGSVAWGATAERLGVRTALVIAAGGLAVAAVIARRFRLFVGEQLDLSPAISWRDPVTVINPEPEEGPVVVTLEFKVEERNRAEFIARMERRSLARRRDGATDWGLYQDAADPARYVEIFTVESWAEHLRQHARTTAESKRHEEGLLALHAGAEPPVISHLVAVHPSDS